MSSYELHPHAQITIYTRSWGDRTHREDFAGDRADLTPVGNPPSEAPISTSNLKDSISNTIKDLKFSKVLLCSVPQCSDTSGRSCYWHRLQAEVAVAASAVAGTSAAASMCGASQPS